MVSLHGQMKNIIFKVTVALWLYASTNKDYLRTTYSKIQVLQDRDDKLVNHQSIIL